MYIYIAICSNSRHRSKRLLHYGAKVRLHEGCGLVDGSVGWMVWILSVPCDRLGLPAPGLYKIQSLRSTINDNETSQVKNIQRGDTSTSTFCQWFHLKWDVVLWTAIEDHALGCWLQFVLKFWPMGKTTMTSNDGNSGTQHVVVKTKNVRCGCKWFYQLVQVCTVSVFSGHLLLTKTDFQNCKPLST